MQTVSFEHMVDGTPEDYDLIGREWPPTRPTT